MTRYASGHKAATRQRLIETAGRRFKRDGIDGSGIATLVADAGLTNGAFYGHFSSKDGLVAAVVAQQLADQTLRMASLPVGADSVEAMVGAYLSPAHRDDVSGGCPSAALLDEIARCGVEIREAYTEGTGGLIAAIARLIDTGDAIEDQERAIAVFSLIVGALQTARAVSDPDLSDRILATARAHAIAIAAAPSHLTQPTEQDSE
ncbi:MAG: TetR/AcrR family transcriptional regulator, transcriptional repressor for nem operon [Actinomycetota bacterium]|jgi:AcrR family transcriptional regulator|nr:TetR/AcrR family transcriptional regulator, transcriptional repressor for nem operon [Actinomycetota bacterium]